MKKLVAVAAAAAVAAEAVAVVVVAVSKEGGMITLLAMAVAVVLTCPMGVIISLADPGAGIRRVAATLIMLRMLNFRLLSPYLGSE